MEIETIGRQEAKYLKNIMIKELEPVLKKYGLTITDKGGTFGGDFYDAKFHIELPGIAAKKSETDFNNYAEMYGIKAPFGFSYTQGNHTYTVDGLNLNKPRNRVGLKRDDGKLYQCDVRSINNMWERHERRRAGGFSADTARTLPN